MMKKEYKEIIDKYNGNFSLISTHQTLSEDFIREFQDKVDWFWITRIQKLSEDFIKESDINSLILD